MATIVQPYNPWREQLALTALGNVAGNILGDLWQTHKQNEQNRKANAFRGALSENLKNIAQQADITLAQPEAPQGYNSNPWAAAFHQKYAPLTQFDIGTSQRQPTLQDIAQNADNLAASKRFSMLSPEMVQSIKNDFFNQAETKRLQDLQNSYIDSFRNANNPAEMLRQLTMGVGQGALQKEALQYFSPWAVQQTPQYKEVDAGDRIIGSVFRPYDGSITPTAQFNVGVSPNIAATVQGNIDAANIHANATRDVANINAQSDYARAQATIRAQQITALQDRAKALREEIAHDRENLRDMDEKDANIFLDTVIAPKELKLKRLEDMMLRGYGGMGVQTQGAVNTTSNQPNSNNVWFSMVGSPKGISIHPHGSFGYDRGDHKHAGIDIRGVNEGTDIKLTHEMGDTFTVKQAYFSKSFGNNIVVESNRKFNGKTVQFRIAHMQDGSLNLKQGQTIKAGDIVGKVGSTGRSTGPHIHFEVIVDGQQVDPSTFFQIYTADTIPQQPQSTSQTTTKSQPQSSTQVQISNSQANNQGGVPYLVKDGDMLTLEAFDKIREQGNYDPETLFNILTEQKGWQLATSTSTPNVTASHELTPQNTTNTEHVTQTKQSPPQNWPFALPGRPQYPQSWNPQISDVVNWINSHQNNENPFARPSFDYKPNLTTAPINNPVTTGANPWSYVNEHPFNLWNFFDWIDNGTLNDNDIIPQIGYFSPSQPLIYNEAAAKVLQELRLDRRNFLNRR